MLLCSILHSNQPDPTRFDQVYATRPQLVTRHALPAAFALLQEARADMRAANSKLMGVLSALLGPAALEEQVGALPGAAAQQRARELLAMLR